jgi:hypothetical protein
MRRISFTSRPGCAGDLEEDVALTARGVRDRGDVVVAVGSRQSSWDPLAMEEVAHDPVGDRPIFAAVGDVMVRAQPDVIRDSESTRSTQAHGHKIS